LRNDQKAALHANCKARDLDNVYVIDRRVSVSSGAVNPALKMNHLDDAGPSHVFEIVDAD
jgi:hypothetical protein